MQSTPQQEIQRLTALRGSDQDPDGRAFAPLADAMRRAGDLEGAVNVLREGIEHHDGFATAWIVAGWVHLDRGDSGEAEAAFHRATELDDGNRNAWVGLADVAEARGDTDGALKHLERAWLLDDSDDLDARIADLNAPPATPEVEDPVMELADLAPDPEIVEDVLPGDLVMELADLAPDPVIELADLAPDPVEEAPEEPVMELADLAPEPVVVEDVLPEGPVVELADLAPDPAPATEEPEELVTRSMGEVFAAQGLYDKAIGVFERLQQRDPSDASLVTRLVELRALANAKAPDA